ncbi:MAG: LCP family protein [Motilibacteraceae bacterium]
MSDEPSPPPGRTDPAPTASTSPAAPGAPGPARLTRRGRRLRLAVGVGLAAVLTLVVGAGGVFAWATGRIAHVDVFGRLGGRPAAGPTDAMNILLVGSDSREGLTAEQSRQLRVGTTASAAGRRSDTMMLVHLSADRRSVLVVSLPRDSYVAIPGHGHNKLNAAYAFGGPSLTVQTVEQATGVHVDHYVEVGFEGFAGVVDSLGGAEVCLPRAIHDDKSHLDLAAGRHHLDGIEALKYVRTRDFDGRGDLGRIERQQAFIGSVVRQAASASTLANPLKLTRLLDAVLGSLTTDPGLGRGTMLSLATSLRNLSPSDVRFVTVPLADVDYRPGAIGSTVLWDQQAAGDLFAALVQDRPVGAVPSHKAPAAGAPTVPPGSLKVRVLNATSTAGLARRGADDLAKAGFGVVGAPANATRQGLPVSVIRYDPRWDESVKTLAAALPGARLEQAPGLGATFEVLLGASYDGVTPVHVSAPGAAAGTPAAGTATHAAAVKTTDAATDALCG